MTTKKISRDKKPTRKQSHKQSLLNTHHRILVVDDDKDIRYLNTEVLGDSGYIVDSAADGALAWEALQTKDYDLLLTDYDMPRLNGLNLIRKLRAAGTTIPVILMSGTVPTKELEHPWLHIDATLPKPYTFDDLLACVQYVLGTSDSIQQPAPSPHLLNAPPDSLPPERGNPRRAA